MERHNNKIMFGFIKKMFLRLLARVVVNVSSHIKCVSLSNPKCEIQATLINLHSNEYSQELHFYSFAVKLDGCIEVVIKTLAKHIYHVKIIVHFMVANVWNDNECCCECKNNNICEKDYI